jgi:hypothetical protein
MRFRLLDTMGDPQNVNLCFVTRFVAGIERHSYRTHLGEPLAPDYPPVGRILLSGDHPGRGLSSFIGNERSMMIVCSSFADAVMTHCDAGVEVLPLTICDQHGDTLSADYFIINPLGAYDCLDLERSDITLSSRDPAKILRIRRHVLDRDKMAGAPQLFRVAGDPSEYVIGRQLARDLYDRKLSNVFWSELPFGDET